MRGPAPPVPRPAMRLWLGALVGIALVCVVAGAVSFAFVFESASMRYKFGTDRILLRSGKVIGILAACLVLFQLLWSARLRFLDRILALNHLYTVHRICAMMLIVLALIHPVLILMADNMLFIPLQMRYWPEFAGLFLLLGLSGMAGTSFFREAVGLPFHRWRFLHRIAAAAVPAALFVHVLFVSDTFESGLPRQAVFAAIFAYAGLYAWVKSRPVRIRQKPFVITSVAPAGRDAFSIRMEPQIPAAAQNAGRLWPAYLPGQFAFLTIRSPGITKEEHPFTIASSPARPGGPEFVIRTCGDWTRRIGSVRPGDRAFINGPFGLFTHLRFSPGREIIMIAGGIGITPMLSMLRYMADTGHPGPVTLIWSNRSREHVIFPDEFTDLQNRLPGFRVFSLFTQEASPAGQSGRLDQNRLGEMLSGCSPRAAVLLCGPPQMTRELSRALSRIGFPRSAIFTECFSL